MKTSSMKIILGLLLCLFAAGSFAQQTITMNSSTNGSTVNLTSCSATLYDSGGPNGNYGTNESYRITVCVPNGFPMELDVTMVTEGQQYNYYDYLSIYEGTGTSGTLVANRIGSQSSGTTFTASYSLNSSCATFVWTTDGSVTYSGFEIQISCGIECQDYTVSITPEAQYDATEEAYLGCSGSTVSALVNFPNNNQNYQQTIANTNFSWSVLNSNGTQVFEGLGMNELSEPLAPGAYFYTLTTTDMNGCQVVSNTVTVYISVPPTFTGTNVTPSICSGDAAALVGVVNPPEEWEMTIEEVNYEQHCFDDDHVDEEQVSCFTYAAFPGQFITSATDIESIGMRMEHSYMGDLDIYIQCPNGQRMTLFTQACGGTYFGEAVDYDDTGRSCNDGDQWVGVGYDYYWTHGNNRGLMSANCSGVSILPAGDYQPVGSFSDLVGCPINGEWCVIFVDNIGIDDGTVFQTELHFADHIIPAEENRISFQNTYDMSETSQDLTWNGDDVFQDMTASTISTPGIPGQH